MSNEPRRRFFEDMMMSCCVPNYSLEVVLKEPTPVREFSKRYFPFNRNK